MKWTVLKIQVLILVVMVCGAVLCTWGYIHHENKVRAARARAETIFELQDQYSEITTNALSYYADTVGRTVRQMIRKMDDEKITADEADVRDADGLWALAKLAEYREARENVEQLLAELEKLDYNRQCSMRLRGLFSLALDQARLYDIDLEMYPDFVSSFNNALLKAQALDLEREWTRVYCDRSDVERVYAWEEGDFQEVQILADAVYGYWEAGIMVKSLIKVGKATYFKAAKKELKEFRAERWGDNAFQIASRIRAHVDESGRSLRDLGTSDRELASKNNLPNFPHED